MEPDNSMALEGKRIEVNGIHLNVFDQGKGEVVLLLHGMPDTLNVWKYQIPVLLKAGYRVVAPDLIGYGKSDKPKALEHYQSANVEKDLLTLIDQLGLKDINLIGHDWGAVIGWDLVSFYPERFKRYVTLSIGHPIPAFGQLSTDDIAVNWYMFLDAQDSAPDLYLLNDCQFIREYIMPEHPEINEVCERLKGPGAMQGNCNWDKANPMADAYIAVLSGELEKLYPKVKVPTMGIWSTDDRYLGEKQMQETAKFMAADWRYERIENATHWVMLDQPETVNQLLLDWLQKQ